MRSSNVLYVYYIEPLRATQEPKTKKGGSQSIPIIFELKRMVRAVKAPITENRRLFVPAKFGGFNTTVV